MKAVAVLLAGEFYACVQATCGIKLREAPPSFLR